MSRSRRPKANTQEILRSKVRLDGVGEDPVVRALMQRLPTASNEEAAEIALALQKLLRGDNSYLEDPRSRDKVAQVRESFAKMDRAAESYDKDPNAFISEVYDKALSKLPVGDKLERLKADAAKQAKNIFAAERAGAAMDRAAFEREIKYGPKDDINVPPQFETRVYNGAPMTVQIPLVLSIKNKTFILPPGVQSVPRPVALMFKQWQKLNQEGAERLQAMQSDDHWGKVKKSWKELDEKYNTVTRLPA